MAKRRRVCGLFVFSILNFGQIMAAAPAEFSSWLPLTDAERQQKESIVEPGAGAEILLWTVHVEDRILEKRRIFYHYIRLKVFDERGKAATTTIDIPYSEPDKVENVAGHTIKADGSIVELDAKTVFQ